MACYNWFLIHHGDRRRGGRMRSGRCSSGVRGSPSVIPRPCLTKSVLFVMTRSSQLCFSRPGNRLVSLWSMGLMHDMLGVT